MSYRRFFVMGLLIDIITSMAQRAFGELCKVRLAKFRGYTDMPFTYTLKSAKYEAFTNTTEPKNISMSNLDTIAEIKIYIIPNFAQKFKKTQI